MATIKLTDGVILLHVEAFLPIGLADRYFAELRDTLVWEQKPGVFGHMQPRLTASYGDEGVTYHWPRDERLGFLFLGTTVVHIHAEPCDDPRSLRIGRELEGWTSRIGANRTKNKARHREAIPKQSSTP
jgi:hypothetical protein